MPSAQDVFQRTFLNAEYKKRPGGGLRKVAFCRTHSRKVLTDVLTDREHIPCKGSPTSFSP